MTLDTKALREAAERATKGPWSVSGKQTVKAGPIRQIASVNWNNGPQNAAYIASASPAAILELLDRLEKAEDKIEGLESDLSSAVEVAHKRGAVEWARLNYPNHPCLKEPRT